MRDVIHIVHWEMSGIYEVAKTLQKRGEIVGDIHTVITLRKSKSLFDKFLSLFRLSYCLFLILTSRTAFIHCHSFLPFILSIFANNKYSVLTFHNAYPFLKNKDFKSSLKCKILRFIIRVKKPKLSAVGKLVAEYVKSGTNYEALPIQNGMDITEFTFSQPANPMKFIGSIGRLDQEKNYLNLISAISSFSSTFNVEIAGEGVLRSLLEDKIRQEKATNIKLIGFQSDIMSFHQKIDGFICCSHHEGCNLSFIESILIGNPVISTNVGVAYDFPELDFPRMENDQEGMSISIAKWLKTPVEELQNKAKYNRLLAEQLFCINAVYDIYREKIWIV